MSSSSSGNRSGLVVALLGGAVVLLLVVIGLIWWAPWNASTDALSPTPSSSTSTSSATASKSSSPTASASAAAPAELVISATALTLKDVNGGTLWSHKFTDNPSTVVTDLSLATGVSPAATDLSADPTSVFKARYEWSGFKLFASRDGWDTPNSLLTAYSVWTSAPKLSQLKVTTPESISVGTPEADLAPFAGPSSVSGCFMLEKDAGSGVDDPAQGGAFTGRFLNACVDPSAGVVVYLMSPHTLFVDQ